MRRRLLIAAIFLLAGAVVNVAVAWGCAAWVDPVGTPYAPSAPWMLAPIKASAAMGRLFGGDDDAPFALWQVGVYQAQGARVVVSYWLDGDSVSGMGGSIPAAPPEPLIPRWAQFLAPPGDGASSHMWHLRLADGRGWPCLALLSGQTGDGPSWSRPAADSRFASLTIESTKRVGAYQGSIVLPLRLIWPGFAVNTLFYATALWLLIPGSFVLRRFIRIRRGLCPACGYDLRYGEHDACPECGRLSSVR